MALITYGDGTNQGYAEADTNGGASATVSVALGWAQAPGDLIIVYVTFAVAVGPVLAGYPQDTSGNTYVQIGTNISDPSSNFTIATYACTNAKRASASSNTVTVKVTSAGVAGDTLIAIEGATAPGCFWVKDQFNHNNGTGTTATPGSVTTTNPNEFLSAAASVANAVTGGPSSPWINHAADPNGGMESYYIATTIQSAVNPSYTQTSGVWAAQIVTFAAIQMVATLPVNQRPPGFPRNGPLPGISLLNKGILVPQTPALTISNVYPAGFVDPEVAIGSAVVTVTNPGYFLPTQQRAPGFPLTAPIPGIALLGNSLLVPVSTVINVTNLYPLGIDTLEAWGALLMSVTVYPAGIDNSNFSGSGGSAPNVAGAGLGGGEAFGSEGLAASVLPGGINSSESSGSSGGAPNVAGAGLGGSDAFGSEGFALNIAASGLNTSDGLGASGMAASVLPSSIDTKETLGAQSQTTNLAMSGIKSEEALGSMSASQVSAVFPNCIESQESFGGLVLTFINAMLIKFFPDRRSPRAGGGRRGRG